MEEYKYCPICGAEYDADVENCADCFVKLVSAEELQAMKARPPKAEEPLETVAHITEDSQEAQSVAEALACEGLSARVERIDKMAAGLSFTPSWIFHVVVPTEEREKARLMLQYKLSATPQPQADVAASDFRWHKLREVVIRLEAAIEAEEEGLPALAEFFGEPEEIHLRAMRAAVSLGEAGQEALMEWLKKTCREKELEPPEMRAAGDACRLLGREDPEWAAGELARELMNPDAWARKNFCYALGKLGSELAIPFLVTELRDPDPAVRSEALDHLYNFKHTDYGFDPDVEPEEQSEALVRWQKLASALR